MKNGTPPPVAMKRKIVFNKKTPEKGNGVPPEESPESSNPSILGALASPKSQTLKSRILGVQQRRNLSKENLLNEIKEISKSPIDLTSDQFAEWLNGKQEEEDGEKWASVKEASVRWLSKWTTVVKKQNEPKDKNTRLRELVQNEKTKRATTYGHILEELTLASPDDPVDSFTVELFCDWIRRGRFRDVDLVSLHRAVENWLAIPYPFHLWESDASSLSDDENLRRVIIDQKGKRQSYLGLYHLIKTSLPEEKASVLCSDKDFFRWLYTGEVPTSGNWPLAKAAIVSWSRAFGVAPQGRKRSSSTPLGSRNSSQISAPDSDLGVDTVADSPSTESKAEDFASLQKRLSRRGIHVPTPADMEKAIFNTTSPDVAYIEIEEVTKRKLPISVKRFNKWVNKGCKKHSGRYTEVAELVILWMDQLEETRPLSKRSRTEPSRVTPSKSRAVGANPSSNVVHLVRMPLSLQNALTVTIPGNLPIKPADTNPS